MARKSSDMILLLGSRGRSRGRSSSFGHKLRGIAAKAFGSGAQSGRGASWVSGGRRAGGVSLLAMMPGWLAVALALACFVGGYFVGGHFASAKELTPQGAGLNANGGDRGNTGDGLAGRAPSMIGEVDAKVLSSTAFVLSGYAHLEPAAAKAAAKALTDRLQGYGLANARPHEFRTDAGPVWAAVVYYDGPTQEKLTKAQIEALPAEAGDDVMRSFKRTDPSWPLPQQIQ